MKMLPLEISGSDRILILAPHPDDEAIGAGGILARFAPQCDVICVSDGAKADKTKSETQQKKERKKEFEAEMRYASVHYFDMLGLRDGQLAEEPDCLSGIPWREYSLIFLPWEEDQHPDHAAVFFYAAEALKKADFSGRVYRYEVHLPFQDCTHYLDITAEMERKERLIGFHRSQLARHSYSLQARALARYRACQDGYAEGFYECYTELSLSEGLNIESMERERELQKYLSLFRLLRTWLSIKLDGRRLSEALPEGKIGIYGYADLGRLLRRELEQEGISVSCLFDRRLAGQEAEGMRILSPQEAGRDAELVIITAASGGSAIRKGLETLGCSAVLLEELLEAAAHGAGRLPIQENAASYIKENGAQKEA